MATDTSAVTPAMTTQDGVAASPRSVHSMTPDAVRLWARTGVLAALALVLSYLETFIPLPVPIPGAKLGLANIPVLLALVLLDTKSALAIAVVKTLAAGLLFGSPLMVPYSAAGTLLAFVGMAALLRLPGLSVVLVSMAGSILHIAGQLFVALLMLGTPLVFYTFPLLGIIACATGALTGKMAAYLIRVLQDNEQAAPLCAESWDLANVAPGDGLFKRTAKGRCGIAARTDARILVVALGLYFVGALLASDARVLGVCLGVAVVCALGARVRLREVVRAAGPLLSILVITVVAQVFYTQQGAVVAEVGPIAITAEALRTVGIMMVRLVCLMLVSVAFSRVVDIDELVCALRFFLRPLQRIGLRTEGFLVSLDLAFQFLPVLVGQFKRIRAERVEADPDLSARGVLRKLRGYRGVVAELAVGSFAYADEVATRVLGDERG